MKVKVLYLETPSGYGGSMQSLLELIAYLSPEIIPIVACPYDPRQYRDVPDKIQWELITSPKPWGAHGYLRLLTHQLGWYRVVRGLTVKYRPDIVHFNNTFFGCFGGGVAVKQRGIATIAHARGFVASRRLARRVARYFDYHISVSRAVAQNLIEHGVKPEKCQVIYNPIVAPTELQPPQRTAGRDIPVVGMVGMLQRLKGQHVFIEALHLLRRRSVHFHAKIAGSEPFGPRGYLNHLQMLVKQYELTDRVEFLGYVRDPFRVLAELDIAVHASIEPEPLGRVVVEAMAVGVPVVGTDGGGVPEMIEHGVTGLLVPMGDAEAMAEAIEQLIRDPALRQRLGKAGQERAHEMFDPVKHARAVEQVYGRALGAHGSRTA